MKRLGAYLTNLAYGLALLPLYNRHRLIVTYTHFLNLSMADVFF